MSIIGHDGIDICHGRLSLYGWMDCPNQGLGAGTSKKFGHDECLFKWIRDYYIYIIIKGTTMDDDSTNVVHYVFAHTIILCGFWSSSNTTRQANLNARRFEAGRQGAYLFLLLCFVSLFRSHVKDGGLESAAQRRSVWKR